MSLVYLLFSFEAVNFQLWSQPPNKINKLPHQQIATSIHPFATHGVQRIILSLRSIACLVGRDHRNQALEQSMDLSPCWDCLAYSGDVLQHALLDHQSDLGHTGGSLMIFYFGKVHFFLVVGGGWRNQEVNPRVPKKRKLWRRKKLIKVGHVFEVKEWLNEDFFFCLTPSKRCKRKIIISFDIHSSCLLRPGEGGSFWTKWFKFESGFFLSWCGTFGPQAYGLWSWHAGKVWCSASNQRILVDF